MSAAELQVTELGADLRHVDTWLFDLDNTLYAQETGIWRLIGARITEWVARATGLPADEAHALQKRYLMDYGITLRGLMLHHGSDPEEYHDYVHDVPLDALKPDPALTAALARLPGRRLVFTNADDKHAVRVLARLGIADQFEEVFHIASADYWPKPSPESFSRLVAAHGITPASAAFFEDTERNLEGAAAIGMTTILVGADADNSRASFVHHRAAALVPFLETARLSSGHG